jgi:hypothetical protein
VQGGELNHPHFFFDLADPSKKSDSQIEKVLAVIGAYRPYGQVTLGVNENEAHKLYEALQRQGKFSFMHNTLEERGQQVAAQLSIDRLLVHPIDRCYSFAPDQPPVCLPGRKVTQPKVATGGGDNFNAGFYFGELHGFTLEQSMLAAMATSGAYVQNGQSPDKNELKNYLKLWLSEIRAL